jgi:uncharacterized protein (DUF2236 family)
VHNALTDSFLQAFQVYGPGALSAADADRFVAEQTAIGKLLGADPTPATARGLAAWISEHPDLGPSPGLAETVGFIRKPPLPWHVRIPYRLMYAAATASLPLRVRHILGVRKLPRAVLVGRLLIGALRWALGSSPSWHISLVRVGAPIPAGLFRQALPTAGRIDQDGSMRGVQP